ISFRKNCETRKFKMRLDKFLKVSRIIKRRSVAKDIADQGRVTVNGKVAKSSSKVAIGDEIVINFGNKTLTVKVNDIKDTTKKKDKTKKNESQDLYTVVSEEYQEDYRM